MIYTQSLTEMKNITHTSSQQTNKHLTHTHTTVNQFVVTKECCDQLIEILGNFSIRPLPSLKATTKLFNHPPPHTLLKIFLNVWGGEQGGVPIFIFNISDLYLKPRLPSVYIHFQSIILQSSGYFLQNSLNSVFK